jgi:hypothetical protein
MTIDINHHPGGFSNSSHDFFLIQSAPCSPRSDLAYPWFGKSLLLCSIRKNRPWRNLFADRHITKPRGPTSIARNERNEPSLKNQLDAAQANCVKMFEIAIRFAKCAISKKTNSSFQDRTRLIPILGIFWN